ncbi:MAG: SgcJ/EcaC family oxidoreductase [Pirellulales bacterium]
MCRIRNLAVALLTLLAGASVTPGAWAQEEAAVRKAAEQLAVAFDAGKTDEIVAMFVPQGEVIDEEGTVYQGAKEIKALLEAFFARFPGAKLSVNIESIRLLGPIAIEEGTRTITTKDGATKSQFRFLAVRVKTDAGWKLASIRDFADDPAPTAHERLQDVAWLVGDWVNEGADGKVAITYRWSEDKNFLLGEFQFNPGEGAARKSSQRIGWDPAAGKLRSWLFDSDGGFAEGVWTIVDDGVVIKSASVNPDGTTASATVSIVPADKNRFTMAGTERIVGSDREPDFEITVVRRPPSAAK